MPLNLIRGDITKVRCDAIVNAANSSLLGGGGVDGAIHRAAGEGLLAECRTLGGCETGEAKLTGGYQLPAKYVIHTVGPIWHGGSKGEAALLRKCYLSSLTLAAAHDCDSVAFPLISAGAYGYPRAEAQRIAVQTIAEFLETHEMQVFLVIYDHSGDTGSYPDSVRMLDAHMRFAANAAPMMQSAALPREKRHGIFRKPFGGAKRTEETADFAAAPAAAELREETACGAFQPPSSLARALNEIDESFTEMLLRKIDERGMTDAQCYKKANVDRKLFSKIRSDLHYKPKKVTAIAFALALELSLPETEELLRKAGYALSGSNKFDIIVTYYISRGIFDVFRINEALFAFDQLLIGA